MKTTISILLVVVLCGCIKNDPGKVLAPEGMLYTSTVYTFSSTEPIPDNAIWRVNGQDKSVGQSMEFSFYEEGSVVIDAVEVSKRKNKKAYIQGTYYIHPLYECFGNSLLHAGDFDSTTSNHRWKTGLLKQIGERKMELKLTNPDGEFWYFQFSLNEPEVVSFDTQLTYDYNVPTQEYGYMQVQGTIVRKGNYVTIHMNTDEGEYLENFFAVIDN